MAISNHNKVIVIRTLWAVNEYQTLSCSETRSDCFGEYVLFIFYLKFCEIFKHASQQLRVMCHSSPMKSRKALQELASFSATFSWEKRRCVYAVNVYQVESSSRKAKSVSHSTEHVKSFVRAGLSRFHG